MEPFPTPVAFLSLKVVPDGNIVENIQIYTCQVAAVFLSSPHFAFQVEKRDLISGDVRDTGDWGRRNWDDDLRLREATRWVSGSLRSERTTAS
jgi:hypothetical protein